MRYKSLSIIKVCCITVVIYYYTNCKQVEEVACIVVGADINVVLYICCRDADGVTAAVSGS